MPVFYRLHAGNIKEVKVFRFTLKESGIHKAIIIGDKGFYSRENLSALKAEQLEYIIPVKRDNSLLDYSEIKGNTFKGKGNYFQHEKRFIWYDEMAIAEQGAEILNRDKIFLFLDETLRLKEETDYLQRIATHPEEYSQEGYPENRDRFGTIGLVSNVSEKTPNEIYIAYKSRMAIEEMFDSLKNVVDADSTYMQNEDALQGWMFINHIALQWYQQIYLLLKDKKLTSKYSVRDFLVLLRDVRKVRINEQWYQAEITKAVAKLLDKI
jgi:transposase